MGFEVAKIVSGLTVGFGGSAVAGTLLKAFMPSNLSKIDKVVYEVGSIAISSAVGTACINESNRMLNTFAECFKKEAN